MKLLQPKSDRVEPELAFWERNSAFVILCFGWLWMGNDWTEINPSLLMVY